MAELLIAAGPGEWRAAWVEDGEARELYVERGDTKPPGSRHVGRLKRIIPSLDAAFVDIGDARLGFLPLGELPDGVNAEEGAALVVEIRREAWGDKGPRLTAKIIDPPALPADPIPPVQLAPPSGLAPALALRLPAMPEHVAADDAAILAELRSAFPDATISQRAAPGWRFDLDALFDAALAPSLALPAGGAFHLDETRGATIVDIDTGSQERGSSARAALAANRAATRLIARELRLRNCGGAIVIDFVGLERRDHREQVRRAFESALASDPAQPRVLGWTRLGHLELVRPRRGRPLADAMLCPGTRSRLPIALAHEALRRVLREAQVNPAASWGLTASRSVEAALRGEAAAALRALEIRLGRRVTITAATGIAAFDIAAI